VYAYLKDVLAHLPTQRASEIGELCRVVGNQLSCARRDARPLSLKIREAKAKAAKAKAEAGPYEDEYNAALGRELRLLRAWEKSERRLRRIDNMVPIQPLGRP
jgi:triphosphoribosyl-dephospho-CoA synthetase